MATAPQMAVRTRDMSLTVRVYVPKIDVLRIRAGVWLYRLASWVSGIECEIIRKEGD